MNKRTSSDVFEVLSNALRRGILVHIRKRNAASFTDLINACSLDVLWDCGTLGYHLNILVRKGIIKKENGKYELTNFGMQINSLLESIEKTEVNKEMVQQTIMVFGRAGGGLDCGGIIAKHVKRGDQAFALVEWDTPA